MTLQLCWLPDQVRFDVGFNKMSKMSSLENETEIIGQAICVSCFGHNKRTSANSSYMDLMGALWVEGYTSWDIPLENGSYVSLSDW